MSNIEIYWQKITDLLKQEMNEITFDTFISPIIPVKYTDSLFVGSINMSVVAYKDIIKKKYSDKINKALTEVFSRPMSFVFDDEISDTKTKEEPVESIASVQRENGLITNYLFNNYIVGSSNNIAYAAAVAVADNPGEDDMYNPLFLYGGVGLGKTHLMHAIGNHVTACNPDAKVLYVSCEKFTTELVEAIRDKKTIEFKERYRQLDLLLIDDVQFLSGKEAAQEEFFHTFNALFDAKKQIVMCSDRKPSEIQTLTDRLISRMSKGLIFDIKAPDFETRTAILAKKAESKNIKIPNEILQYIAYTITSNIREMEGALNKIVIYAKFNNRVIDMELAEEVMKDVIKDNKANITVSYIQETVADFYKVSVEELLSKRRTKPLTTYRHIAMYLCRKLLEDSLEEIGEKFGGRDHSTVMNGCDKVCKLMESNDERVAEIKSIEKRIVGN
ncbi:MAG: chromosomal replication initiator protein DnaA [Clostridia bacterium]|nr:chromosomal replication initiator protein DnaA [Clostridia bacterium]